MIKEAIQYVLNLKKEPIVIDDDGNEYNCLINNELTPMEKVKEIKHHVQKTIETHTLTSILDYLKFNPDGLDLKKIYLGISNENTVYVESSTFGDYKQKETYLIARYNQPNRNIGEFITLETMLIMLNSTFEMNPDLEKVIRVLSKVTDSELKETLDDGLSQTVKVKSGIELSKEEKLPKLVSLIPFRTFTEAEQPLSNFLLRAQKAFRGEGLKYALFSADGGQWKNQCIYNIKSWLSYELEKAKLDIPILA